MDLMAYTYQIVQRSVQCIYPPRCLLCGGKGMVIGLEALDICKFCYSRLPDNLSACVRCALSLPPDLFTDKVCGRCQKNPPAFDYSVSLFRYEQPVVWLIRRLKFNERLSHAKLLGKILSEVITQRLVQKDDVRTILPECILPVPLHKRRLGSRGFNQSIEIARLVAKTTGLPLEINLVERVRATESQTGLDAAERKKNLRGVFKVVGIIQYDHVVIVDDVVTTGSTVNELAKVLKKSGVKRVDVWSIARAL